MKDEPKKPNGYDISFMRWFYNHGWRIHRFIGECAVWPKDDATCRFRVTDGMIQRLESAGLIRRIYPDNAGVHDEFYAAVYPWPKGITV